MKLCAVISARNEAHYLPITLAHLRDSGVDAIIIDNASDDGTPEVLAAFKNAPILDVMTVPYDGTFSLQRQMAQKQEIYDTLNHDWLIHMDADEIIQSARYKESLKDMVGRADKIGATVINLDEFVFLPRPDQQLEGRDFYQECLRYYVHDPRPHRLQRLWKNGLGLSSAGRAGHVIEGEAHRLFSENQILRHYIVLSNRHAAEKYVGRPFDPSEVQKGMHRNRLNLTPQHVALPKNAPALRSLVIPDSPLKKDAPSKRHYWAWQTVQEDAGTEK